MRVPLCLALVAGPATLWAQPAAPPPAPAAIDTPAVTGEEIARLIGQLGDDRFFVREQAQAKLAKLGHEAFDALVTAQDHEDIEIASRAKYLVRLVQIDWAIDGDPAPLEQLMEGFDQLDVAQRSDRIRQLAATTDPPWVAALCRVVRFERSALLSKQAAVRLIEQSGLPTDAWPARGQWILAQLGPSPRQSAQWVRLYVRSQADPAAVLPEWEKALELEEQTLLQYPEETDNAIVASLLRYQIGLYERLDKSEQIERSIARLVATEPGETGSMVKLIQWLVGRKSWEGLESLRQRFAGRFEQEPLLAYCLAGARRAQGDDAAAEKLAAAAKTLNPADAHQHLQLAVWLREQGWTDWAEQELRLVIEIGPAEGNDTLTAQYRLADLLHDRLADEEAGKVLQEAIAALDKAAQAAGNRQPQFREIVEESRRVISSRMHYYLACHHQQQRDRAKEAEQLLAGILNDPLDADILIALYRLPDQTDQERAQTQARIDEAVARYKVRIAENQDDPNAHNQLAWLLSNTDREQELALKASLESLRLKPGEPGYLDTLGRCYFALKDYANAVKYQQQAVAGEPHSGQMRRQLELFQKALADSQSAPPP